MANLKHCSKIIACKILSTIECVHCGTLNYVSQTDNPNENGDYNVGEELEEITCWSCCKSSLVDEELLLMYPKYPNESVSGHFDGQTCSERTS